MPIEYEAKFLGIDKDQFRNILQMAGYYCAMLEFLYRRQTFDVLGFGPEKWGRVRWEKDVINLSIKHTTDPDAVDGTHEYLLNIPIGDNPDQQYREAIDFMKACGLTEAGAQENYRETWIKGEIEVCLDTWPGLRPYVEIEGPDEQIVRHAVQELGLDFSEALFGGATAAYQAELGISPADFGKIKIVTFEQPPKI